MRRAHSQVRPGIIQQWEALRREMGSPTWADSPAFADQFLRWKNRGEIDAHLGEWTRQHDHLELAVRLQRAGVPAGQVLDSVEVHRDPHLWQWGYWWEMEHHEVGRRILPGLPVEFSAVTQFNYRPPPDLGQHNREVPGGLLGLSEAEIARLMEVKIVY